MAMNNTPTVVSKKHFLSDGGYITVFHNRTIEDLKLYRERWMGRKKKEIKLIFQINLLV